MIGLMGVTGEVGSKTYEFLNNSNAKLCLFSRNVAKVSDFVSANVQVRKFDFTKFDDTVFDDIQSGHG